MRYTVVSLGCPKNTVDSAGMGRLLEEAGWEWCEDPHRADVVLVNTCGFIQPAREESLEVLGELVTGKRRGQVVIATGCLAQLWGEELLQRVPGVDGVLGTRCWQEIVPLVQRVIQERGKGERPVWVGDGGLGEGVERVAVMGATGYLKIAEGCSANCAFCAIPLIKGPARSRSREAVLADARLLAESGVREIVLIAQDTTAYGRDRGERDGLANLLEDLVREVPEMIWIRLMYAYPQHISPRLIEVMASHAQICHYIDLPLQHAHPAVLRRMRRPDQVDRVRALIDALREAMPDVALRTSFIVGYPGETEEEFAALEAFLEEIRFDRVGVFMYSREEGTDAARLPDQVPEEVKEERYHQLMQKQQAISLASNQAQVGRVLDVLVEGSGDGVAVGRSYRDAPEIDGLVLVSGEYAPGTVLEVRVVEAMAYDLLGEVIRVKAE